MNLSEFVYERMKENQNLFTKKEWAIIKANQELVKKVYMIGAINREHMENIDE